MINHLILNIDLSSLKIAFLYKNSEIITTINANTKVIIIGINALLSGSIK